MIYYTATTKFVTYGEYVMGRKSIGIALIYAAAVCIMFSIVSMFNVLHVRMPYTIAAFGFLLYVLGLFLTREGKFSTYKIAMIALAILLIFLAIFREILKI